MINLLNNITQEARDRFLKKYIGRCKVTHALAFFQWRCRTVCIQESIDANREIFYQRIAHLVNCFEQGLKKKKTAME